MDQATNFNGIVLKDKLTWNALLDHSHNAQHWVNVNPTWEKYFPLYVSRESSQNTYKVPFRKKSSRDSQTE